MSFVIRATISNLVLYFLYIINLAQSQSDPFAMVEKRPVVKACGSELADLLAQACLEPYVHNQGTIQGKRSDYLSDNLVADSEYYNNLEEFPAIGSDPLRLKRNAFSVLRSSRFNKRSSDNIVQDCCINSCTLDDLRSYC